MSLSCRFAVSLFAATLISASAWAQPLQLLKDVWVATGQDLYEVDYDVTSPAFVPMNPGDQSRSFRAVAFLWPTLGTLGSTRDLVAVDGTKILRITEGATPPAPTLLWDASVELTVVNTVATSDAGTVFLSGYSKRKRVFELWELIDDPNSTNPNVMLPQLRATGTPQLTDAVYVSAEDVVDGSVLAGGGVLAVAARSVLFFPANAQSPLAPYSILFDARSLPIKNNAQLLSIDLVHRTNVLMVAASTRQILTVAPNGTGAAVFEPLVPDIAGRRCADIRDQRLLVRNARGQSNATSIVSDVCGQVVRYDFTSVGAFDSRTATILSPAGGLTALAVGEGTFVTCVANDPNGCTLADGFVAHTQETSELLVLQLLTCDPRVQGCTIAPVDALDINCQPNPSADAVVVDTANNLIVNSLLPLALRQDLCENDVTIVLPPTMFGAGYGGVFGALLLKADGLGAGGEVTARLEVSDLVGFELGVRDDFERPQPDIVPLLNQDIAAYAPDNPSLPTVRGFEATPVTTGKINPMLIGIRGGSFIGYGLQHDTNLGVGNLLPRDPTPDPVTGFPGGRPNGPVTGSQRLCNLTSGSQTFIAEDVPAQFFINLAACLWQDEGELLKVVVPAKDANPGLPGVQACVSPGDHATLVARLDNTTDKLIKSLNASGPQAGTENFQAVITQLDQYDQAVAGTTFASACTVYKNELSVRSKAFRFELLERALPSLPLGGFP